MSHGAGSGGGGRPETFIITYGADMSHDLANAMRQQILEAIQRSPNSDQMTNYMRFLCPDVFSRGDVTVSEAARWAAACSCHWEARLVTGAQSLAEGVALVRDP